MLCDLQNICKLEPEQQSVCTKVPEKLLMVVLQHMHVFKGLDLTMLHTAQHKTFTGAQQAGGISEALLASKHVQTSAFCATCHQQCCHMKTTQTHSLLYPFCYQLCKSVRASVIGAAQLYLPCCGVRVNCHHHALLRLRLGLIGDVSRQQP